MKHPLALFCSLLLPSILSTVSWNYHKTSELSERSVQSFQTLEMTKNVEVLKLSKKPKVINEKKEVMATLLAAAGEAGRGQILSLPNPLGSPIPGTITQVKRDAHDVVEVTGRLAAPREGWFLLRKQQIPGKAGPYVGIIDLVSEGQVIQVTAHEANLRPREDVVCVGLPPVDIERARDVGDSYVPGKFLASVLPGIDVNAIPIPTYQNGLVPLQSLRGAAAVAYLDYDGEIVGSWGGVEAAPFSITNEELLEVWERVSEDFAPFTINVTTDEAVFLAANPTSRIRCIVTPTADASPGGGGVAYLDSFNWDGDTPCWAFYRAGKSAAEAISHEIGHTLGLSHDGIDEPGETGTNYYSGHGSGKTSWAPLMGVGYYSDLTQWSKGDYAYATNTEDDLAIITTQNNGVVYRVDDHGNTLIAASELEVYPDGSVQGRGILEQGTDIDAFRFTTNGGSVNLAVEPMDEGANVDLSLSLINQAGTTLLSDQPAASITAAISGTLSPGDYAVRVSPASKGTASSGYTTYATLGHFEITGTIVNAALPTRLGLEEHSANGASAGVVSVDNPNSAPLSYSITSGNDNGTFAISSGGDLTVANHALLDYEVQPQWDLRLNVTNTLNSAYNVVDHRVVVSLSNVNEAPVFSSTAPSGLTFLERSKLRTPVYTPSVTDQDYDTILTYAIESGNALGLFAVDLYTGQVSVNGQLDVAQGTSHTLRIRATDNGTPTRSAAQSLTLRIAESAQGFTPGSIGLSVWTGIDGNALSNLTSHQDYPDSPTQESEILSFETPIDLADDYGVTVRGYVIPPVSGSYTFAIAAKDKGELYFSTDSNPANATKIASAPNWTFVHEWDYQPSFQQSSPVMLVAGQAYYIEARMKEDYNFTFSGSLVADHLAIGWKQSGGSFEVIPGRFLAPFYQNYTPTLEDSTMNVYEHAIAGIEVGTVKGTDLNTDEILNYTIDSGNSTGIFALDPLTGVLRVHDTSALAAAKDDQVLTIRATDNGTPSEHTTATITVELNPEGFIQTVALIQEVWDDITGTSLTALTSNARYPDRPDRLLEHSDFDSGRNLGADYGSRIRAYLTPPASGNYTFSFTSDDQGELWLSTDSSPENAVEIASVDRWSSFGQWTSFASQTSVPIALVANTPYYIETRHKEGGGGDHVRVAWSGGNIVSRTVIADTYLTPFDCNAAPTIPTAISIENPVANTFVATINAIDSAVDELTYELLPTRDADYFLLDSATGALTLLKPTPLKALGALEIDVRVQDSGLGGRFSPRTSQGTIGLVLQEEPTVGESIVSSGLINAARNGGAVATQTTTEFGATASRAVDGDVSNYFASNSVTESAATLPNEAWQVDLGDPCQIHEIAIYNRGETLGYRLSNFEVCVYLEGKQVWAQACHTDGSHVADGGLLSLSGFQWLRGDTVSVRLLGDTPRVLSLAEVEVYAEEAQTGSRTAYKRWAAQVHELDPKSEDGMADSDADGMKNLYEFAVNADPTASESDAGIESETVQDEDDEWVEVQFRRRLDHSDIGLDYAVEFSEGLAEASWSSAIAAVESNVVPNDDGITETVTVRCQLPLSGTRQRLFARLMVSE